MLGPEDGIILGASSAVQLKQNIDDRCVFELYLTPHNTIVVGSSVADASFVFVILALQNLALLLLPPFATTFFRVNVLRMIDDTSEKDPLPQEVLDAVNAAWARVGMDCPPYWR